MDVVVLGIDPGFTTTGFGIIKREQRRTALCDYGALRMSSSHSLSHRIGIFYDFLVPKIIQWQVNVIALETPFLGKNAQNFLKLGYLRGILYLLAHQYDASLSEFTPMQVKRSITGYGSAQKEQVARALIQLLPGLAMPSKLDITDAIAVTLCGLWAQQKAVNSIQATK